MQVNIKRKEKSLGLLCQKFLSFYPIQVNYDEQILISLDQMAIVLEVERRRIYDIVNVLESVEILSRCRKNQYLWHGFAQIPYTLSKLKTLSVKSKFLEYTKALMVSQLDLYYDTKQAMNVCFEPRELISTCNVPSETRDSSTQTISISREEKSLGIMSQKFLMLFLTSEDGLVSINFAARVLLGDSKNDTTEHGRYKTKIRRLYDIANVLTSIGLIKKYTQSSMHISKPAYEYIGPDVDIIRDAEYVFDFINTGNQLSNSKHSLFDHFKRNLNLECNIPKFDINTGILTSKDKSWKKNNENRVQSLSENLRLPISINPMYQHIKPSENFTDYGNRTTQSVDHEIRHDLMYSEAYEPSNTPIMVYNAPCEPTPINNTENMYYTTLSTTDVKDQSLSYDCNNNLIDGYSLPHFNTFLE